MMRYQLSYADEDGILHPLGEPIEAPTGREAKPLLMNLYWDDRLDAASCSPVVTRVRPDDHQDCDESPCPYEVDEAKTTVTYEGREWILLALLRYSDDGKMVGYSVVECGPNGAAKLPAVIHYIEFPTEKLHGNDT